MSAPDELAPGAMLGGTLRVDALLGRGGMGAVYRAHDDVLGPVAVKVLHPDLHDPELLARFAREGEVAARVDGQGGVARVHRAGQDGARRFLVLELVDGVDLDALVRRDGPLGHDEAALLVERLARTLERCHRAGVVHRDLKPHNVLVRPDGSPVLVDFGVAADARAAQRLTVTGELLGTPAWMAPEQLGGGPIDGRVDVRALGTILTFALTGRPPFEGPPMTVLHAVSEQDPPSPRALRPDVPDALDAVARRASARRREERYATAGELADALAATRAGALGPRARALLLAVALLLLALLAGGAAVALRARRERAALEALAALRALDGLDGADPDAPLLRCLFGADPAALDPERARVEDALAALRERADALGPDDRRAADGLLRRVEAALGRAEDPLVVATARFARGAGSPAEVLAVAERAGASSAVARDLRDRAWALRLPAAPTEPELRLLARRLEDDGPPAGAFATALRAWCAERREARLADALAAPGEHVDALRALRQLGASVGVAAVTSAEEAQLDAIGEARAASAAARLLRRDVAAIVGAWTGGAPDRPCPVGTPAQRLVTRLRDAAAKDAPRDAIAFDAALREVADLEPTLEMRRVVLAALERGPSPPASLLVASARADTAVITAQHLGEAEVAALSASPSQAARLVALAWRRSRAQDDDVEAHRAVLLECAAILDAPRRDAGPTTLSRMLEQVMRSAERVLIRQESLLPGDRALARRVYEAWRPVASGPDRVHLGSPFREWLLIEHRVGTFAEGLAASTCALDAALRRDPPVPGGEELRNLVAALGETYCLPPDEGYMARTDAGQRRALLALLERARAEAPDGLGRTTKLEVAVASVRLRDGGDEADARRVLAALPDATATEDWEVARTAAAMIARLDGPAAAAARVRRWAERAAPRGVDLEARARRSEEEAARAVRPPR